MKYQRKSVKGYEGYYEVDTDGMVYGVGKRGDRSFKEIQGTLTGSGYLNIQLCKDGQRVRKKKHHLILEAFIGAKPENMFGCHYNGNKLDNRLENLRWDTRQNNERDKVRHGLSNHGERNGQSKLNIQKVKLIRCLYEEIGWSKQALYKFCRDVYDIVPRTVRQIIGYETWKPLTLEEIKSIYS